MSKSVDFKFSLGQSFAASWAGTGAGRGQSGGVGQGRGRLGWCDLTSIVLRGSGSGGHTRTVHVNNVL